MSRVFTEVAPAPVSLADLKADLLEIGGHFDGLTGFYVQDLATGDEIRHNTYVTTSGMSMIKVAVLVTAYRSITRPFESDLQDAICGHDRAQRQRAVERRDPGHRWRRFPGRYGTRQRDAARTGHEPVIHPRGLPDGGRPGL